MSLSISSAIEFVRASIDELSQHPGDMLIGPEDDRNLDLTVEKLLPTAIEFVHMHAPAELMEGLLLNASMLTSYVTVKDRVIDINFADSEQYKILRLTAFKAGDSDIVLSTAHYEDSPQARMQTDPYTQGQPDEPAIVLMADSALYKPHYRYYTTDLDKADFMMRYFPAAETMEELGGEYFVSSKLKGSVLNYLVSLVLLAYKESNLAEIYKQKALEYFK